MKRHASLVVLALSVVLLAACGGGGGTATLQLGDVAVVGQQAITKDDFDGVINRVKKSYLQGKHTFPKPGTPGYESVKSQVVSYLVERAEVAQKAADMGVHVSAKQVDQSIQQTEKQFYGGSASKYEQAVAQQGLTLAQQRKNVEANLIAQALSKKLTENVHVSDQDIKKYYDQHRSLYVQKQSRDIRHILVKSKTQAETIYAQLVADHEKNFAALAKKFSKDPGSAAKGGRLTVTRGTTVPPFDKVAFSLKTGQLSKPVQTQFGWHVIQALSSIRPATTTPLSKEKAAIRQQLEQQQKQQAVTKFVGDMRRDFCKPGKVRYQAGFAPNPDPCLAVTASTATS